MEQPKRINKKVVLKKAVTLQDELDIKSKYPNAELVAWPSCTLPEKWFSIYRIEEEIPNES